MLKTVLILFLSISTTVLALQLNPEPTWPMDFELDTQTWEEYFLERDEQDLATYAKAWQRIKHNYDRASEASSNKMMRCNKAQWENKPDVANLLLSEFNQDYLVKHYDDIKNSFLYLNNDLLLKCYQPEFNSLILAEVEFFSATDSWLKKLIGYFDSISATELDESFAKTHLVFLQEILEQYEKHPYQASSGYFILRHSLNNGFYKEQVQKAPVELYTFIESEFTSPISTTHLVDEFNKLH